MDEIQEKALLRLVDELKQEINDKDKLINVLTNQIEGTKLYGAEWIHANNYKNAIEEVHGIRDLYKKQLEELLKVKAEYLAMIQKLIDKF
ncbi:hypothetical protein [Faecalibaculum rodentium]|uniref:hypothetical protein n=1 Tax=Faecalibaculum rodentium TaxID=1702221 RepID=UPI00272FFEA7|nr:hypothetical protein [Faecalibaculum rodentium]